MSAQISPPINDVSAHCFGILVGVSTFEDPEYTKRPIQTATADATDVRDALIEKWNWPPKNIILLTGKVAQADIRKGFAELLRLLESDNEAPTCLIYFSTHGHLLKARKGKHAKDLILLTSDSSVGDVFSALEGLTRWKLEGYVNALPADRKLIILDACYSALMPAAQLTSNDIYQPTDAAVLASSRLASRFDPKTRNSEFTGVLLQYLRGRRAQLSATDLFQEVSARLRKRKGAPQPILRFDGADILLGVATIGGKRSATSAQIIASFNADTTEALSRKTSLALATYIARPRIERAFAEFLKGSDQPGFTLIAAAGNGKSTSMRALALRCVEEGRPVLWFPEPRSQREMDFERFISSALLPIAEPDLTLLEKLEGRLVVFFDGINEWRDASAVPAFLRRVLALARQYSFRVVVSCRDLAWNSLGGEFTNQNTFAVSGRADEPSAHKVSAYLPVFDDEELNKVLAAYPGLEALIADPLIRHPIFVAVLLRTVNYLGDSSQEVTLSTILREYIRTKVEGAANRLNTETGEIVRRLAAISGDMFQGGRDFITTDNYFELAGSAIGAALLDEALFVSGPNGITAELESIVDYLFAQHLPSDPLADFTSFEQQVEAFPRIKGAISLRLCEIKDAATVKRHLEQLHSAGYTSMILEIMRRLPSLAPYEDLLFNLSREVPPFLMKDAVLPVIRREFTFCLRLAKQFFVDARAYDWELKRWKEVAYPKFRERLGDQLNNDEAVFLFDCINAKLDEGLRVLLFDWLTDASPIEGDGYVTIAGVASIYLRAFGQVHADSLLDLLDAAFNSETWNPNPQLVFSIIKELAQASPAQATEHALRWMTQPKYVAAALCVLEALPMRQPELISELGRRLVEQKENRTIANEALASTARIHDRETLEFVGAFIATPELWPGVLRALCELQASFPNETRALVDALSRRPDLPAESIKIAIAFYCLAANKNFPEFENYAEYVLSSHPEDEDLVRYVFDKVTQTFCAEGPAMCTWSEQWLRHAPNSWAMESLGAAIRKVRRFGIADLVWLERWVTYSNATYYPDWLIDSDLPVEKAADLLTAIEERRALALDKTGEANERLQRIAALIVAKPQLTKFPGPDQQFWRTIAAGQL